MSNSKISPNGVVLQADRVRKSYQMGSVEVRALRDVDFSVGRGEFVAIMGPSGSGKSTLLHLLGGLDLPSEGKITLAGERLDDLNDDEITRVRRRKVGFIFQFYNLLPTLSAAENVALPLLIDGQAMHDHADHIAELLAMVNLGDRAGHRPDQLSGGQQQRVAIARAFVNRPEIVLADEPTGNLDSKAGTTILELLQRACKDMDTTIVMVTHDARAASFAGRVVFLKDGRIVHQLQDGGKGVPVNQIVEVMAELEL
ncbi:MAG: ABC transporter ATP-binding protein [Anaerolineae bacterium]|nr:ABC transporter ATP-binding protein [Anaerolineae bacterium]